MKTTQIFRYLLILAVLIGCKKAADGDLSGDKTIIGRLFLLDTLTKSAINTPLAKKKVTIRYSDSKDTLNYLFSTTTNEEGYFTFSNLKEGRQYTVSYNETIDGVIYNGSDFASAPSNSVIVTGKIANKRQKGIAFTVRDFSGNKLKEASLCIFTSPTTIGYQSGLCDGSSYSLKTDAGGHASLFGIPNGNYYILSTIIINGIPLITRNEVKVADSVSYATVTLAKPNGIHFITKDANSDIIGNVNICVFTSQVLFQNGSCEGSNFQLTSNSGGQADKYNMDKSTYYILSTKVIGKDTLIGKNTVLLGDTVATCVLIMEKK
jgi:hypothetical protein